MSYKNLEEQQYVADRNYFAAEFYHLKVQNPIFRVCYNVFDHPFFCHFKAYTRFPNSCQFLRTPNFQVVCHFVSSFEIRDENNEIRDRKLAIRDENLDIFISNLETR